MEVQFNNVTITIEAESPEAAYNRLCNLLAANGVEYTTDTFRTNAGEGAEESTEKLFPPVGG